MKALHTAIPALTAAMLLIGAPGSGAQEAVPCLIFTGQAEGEQRLDLLQYNRISFGDEGVVISSSKDGEVREVQLLYSLYNHFELGDAVPNVDAGIEETAAADGSRMRYDNATKTISIEADSTRPFTIGIIDLKGALVATSKMYAGQQLPVGELPTGGYIAVATDGTSKSSLKFIVK